MKGCLCVCMGKAALVPGCSGSRQLPAVLSLTTCAELSTLLRCLKSCSEENGLSVLSSGTGSRMVSVASPASSLPLLLLKGRATGPKPMAYLPSRVLKKLITAWSKLVRLS